jgi:hypothetical protein
VEAEEADIRVSAYLGGRECRQGWYIKALDQVQGSSTAFGDNTDCDHELTMHMENKHTRTYVVKAPTVG